MSNEALESPLVGHHRDQSGSRPNDQRDLPDRWTFGLAHPYMQRLIFLSGTLEPINTDPKLD
jgi:hypothetical protein